MTKEGHKWRENSGVRIAIIGPGRSGTTLLTSLFGAWGFSTAQGALSQDAQAGLETRIGTSDNLEVQKDPWAFEYIDAISVDVLKSFDAFILPIRNLGDAAISRSVQERLNRASEIDGDEWKWNAWGGVAGGAVSDTSARGVEQTLAAGLWKTLEVLAKNGIQCRILHFPTLAADFEYVWSSLGDLVATKMNKEDARLAYERVADPSKVRVGNAVSQKMSTRELEELLDQLQKKQRKTQQALDAALLENRSLLNKVVSWLYHSVQRKSK